MKVMAMRDEFDGKAAVVIGAGTGIGEAVATRLHAGGAKVALVSRRLAQVEEVCGRLEPRGGQRAFPVEGDVRDPQSMQDAITRVVERFGKLDLAVNNVGIPGRVNTPIHELEVESWRDVLDTNLSGMLYSMKFEIPPMLANGSGVIVNFSSAMGLGGLRGMAAYTAAKHGVVGLTRSAALELAEANIRVCAVAPGYVATPRVLELSQEATDAMVASHPMKRLATREEVADFVAYLLSERAAFITGSVHCIDGGYSAQ